MITPSNGNQLVIYVLMDFFQMRSVVLEVVGVVVEPVALGFLVELSCAVLVASKLQTAPVKTLVMLAA